MGQVENLETPSLSVAIRTLLLSGYEIENNHRQPTHTEILCRAPLLSVSVPLLIAVTEEDELQEHVMQMLLRVSENSARSLIVVSAAGGRNQLTWRDFLDAFGGAVPSWRALTPEFLAQLGIAAGNALPEGYTGEAWRLFEILVADGLEFCFGRKVRRLGAVRRGSKVSDMLSSLPDGNILVVDAKATSTSFDAAVHNLRPLAEYTAAQRQRQRGYSEVFAALIVSNEFDQDASALLSISREFLSTVGVPACFMTARTLGEIVADLRERPHLRAGIKWKKLFSGGLVTLKEYESEVELLLAERY
jgi:hypothetical protein